MLKESWKVFWACLIGAGLGAFVALESNHYFWWVGLLAGGLTGYLSYEWKKVVAAIPAAYKAARGWRPDVNYWRAFGWGMITMLSICSWMYVLVFLAWVTRDSPANPMELLYCTYGIFPVSLFLGFVIALDKAPDSVIVGKMMTKATFPPIFLFWHIPRAIVYLVRNIPSILKFLRRFSWQMFLRIHSEMRLLCGIDALLGAGIGFFAGSVLVGALAGAAIGLVNYLVVTKGWLEPRGLVPFVSK